MEYERDGMEYRCPRWNMRVCGVCEAGGATQVDTTRAQTGSRQEAAPGGERWGVLIRVSASFLSPLSTLTKGRKSGETSE